MNSQIVNVVLGLLIFLSIVTWSLMLWKGITLNKKKEVDKQFKNLFWASKSIPEAEKVSKNSHSEYALLARTGFSEIQDVRSHAAMLKNQGNLRDVMERTLRQQIQTIVRKNEAGLTELATISSASPFVGLFGTVWGIKNALQEIGMAGQAGLDVVAGPIGEALIATAAGIGVALPAVLAYNFFVRKLAIRQTELENFCEDFLKIATKESI